MKQPNIILSFEDASLIKKRPLKIKNNKNAKEHKIEVMVLAKVDPYDSAFPETPIDYL